MDNESGSVMDSNGEAANVITAKNQDSNSLANCNNSALTVSGQLQATYKQLPDDDVNWQLKNKKTDNNTVNNIKSAVIMAKQNGTEVEQEDGAEERMLKDHVKVSITPAKDTSEVKFISENGDAKIEIEAIKHSLCGMGKAELMKYANDPFWVRLRWCLFILFWLSWIGMLVGAIAIIIVAPKCVAPEARKWYEESPIVDLDMSQFKSKELLDYKKIFDELKEQHIKAISIRRVLKESSLGHVTDYTYVNENLGDVALIESLIATAKENGQHIILELDPNHSSDQHEWFKKSVKKEGNYTDYYVWRNGTEGGKEPNNWISISGGSAWTKHPERQQYYLHQFDKSQPDLNFRSEHVQEEFKKIFKFWISKGVSGFRLKNTDFLFEDKDLQDESASHNPQKGAAPGTYEFLVHKHTRNLQKTIDILRSWRDLILELTNGDGFFTLTDIMANDTLVVYNDKVKTVDLPQHFNYSSVLSSSVTAQQLNHSVFTLLRDSRNLSTWPAFQINSEDNTLRQNIDKNIADSLILTTLLLPATPILNYDDTQSAKQAFAELTALRSGLAFQHGSIKTFVLNNGTVFAYTRYKSGNPGYLVAYNGNNDFTEVDISNISNIPEEVSVIAYSPNYITNGNNTEIAKLSSSKVGLPSKSTLVVSYVPKN